MPTACAKIAIGQWHPSLCFNWTTWGDPGVEHGQGVNLVETNSAGTPCDNGYYMGLSYHWMRGLDGNTYIAVTINVQEVTNCD